MLYFLSTPHPHPQAKSTLRCVCGGLRMFLVTKIPKAGQPFMELYKRASQCVVHPRLWAKGPLAIL